MINGRHPGGKVTRIVETAAFTKRYQLFKAGSDDTKVAPCGASDVPDGVVFDEGAVGDSITVEYFGCGQDSMLAPLAMTITTNPFVVPGADGTITPLPTAAGTYEVVGKIMKGGLGGELAEFAPQRHQRVVTE